MIMERTELDKGRAIGGGALVTSLGEAGVDLVAAFWVLNADMGMWRFVLVSPMVETRGPRYLLRQTAQSLQKLNGSVPFSPFDVDFESPHSASIMMLLKAFSWHNPKNIEVTGIEIEPYGAIYIS